MRLRNVILENGAVCQRGSIWEAHGSSIIIHGYHYTRVSLYTDRVLLIHFAEQSTVYAGKERVKLLT